MIDSHSHIYCDAFDDDRAEMMARAREAGVTHIVLPNENLASLARLEATHNTWHDFTSITIGLHPEEIGTDWRHQLNAMHALLEKDAKKYVAVGEIGIDLYWDKTHRDEQLEALDTQLRWCKEFNLPFIIHCREGVQECLDVMDNFGEPLPRGVFHSFTGTPSDVEKIRCRGDFYFGVNGIITFKKSNVKEIIPVVGLDRLLLETDSPYLAPVPKRGKRNESAFVTHVRDFVAQELAITPQEVEQTADHNAIKLFNLNIPSL